MIYTYRNFISIILQMNTWWYIHTATLYQLSFWWTPYDIYIPQLYINFAADEDVMIYTYRNFISRTRDDIYILQLCINFPADEHLKIYTYRNFIATFLHKNTWWYIHSATLHQVSCRWTPYDIYIPQLYINFTADEHLMTYTYPNVMPTFLHTNTWWIHSATLC